MYCCCHGNIVSDPCSWRSGRSLGSVWRCSGTCLTLPGRCVFGDIISDWI